ncbi:MAG: DUF721 domain-containing protein [Gammaproteobacteria bacterium]|nr:DUF721 domain-containing protein [Gammaproteobacteria bacterium]
MMTISKQHAKSIGELLNSKTGQLHKLIHQTEELQHLDRLFRQTLDNELGGHCHVSKFDGTHMILVVDNANWATNLRYGLPDIIKTLRVQPEFKGLKKINYKVNRY